MKIFVLFKHIMRNKILLLAALLLMAGMRSMMARTQYSHADSIKVVQLLQKAGKQKKGTNYMIFFARELKDIPYVAKTLEVNKEEWLIVNLRQLDCTTYVESVVALTECMKHGKRTFSDYCDYLRQIRYKGGKIGYPYRLHYFSVWITDNTQMGFVEEVQTPNPPFTRIQNINVDYMTTHPQLYPMLMAHKEWIKEIGKLEKEISGKQKRYIPKNAINNNKACRAAIHDGDIIAITTRKKGLDTSHIGIAVWHKDGLHMLNASQIHKKVVEEPMLLRAYMQKHPSQVGIRIIRVK
jgi:hypothetical protein